MRHVHTVEYYSVVKREGATLLLVLRLWKGQLLFNGYRDFVEDDEEGLGIDSGDGYTTLRVYLMPLTVVPMLVTGNTSSPLGTVSSKCLLQLQGTSKVSCQAV